MLLVWVLGLYVLTRGRGMVSTLAGLAMAAFSCYLLGLWAGALARTENVWYWVAWLRWTWWGAPLAAGFWLLLVLAITADEGSGTLQSSLKANLRKLIPLTLSIGGILAILGVGSDLVLRWDESFPSPAPVRISDDVETWHIPTGPLYLVFQAYLLVCLLGATACLTLLFRSSPPNTPLRGRFGWFLASALLFLAGGAYIAVLTAEYGFTAMPGEALLILGMLVLGWNIAHYGALTSGEVVAADFRAFALATLTVIIFYGALLWLGPRESPWLIAARVLLIVIVTTHLLASRSSMLMDRLFFEPSVRSVRGQLEELADRVVRHPDALAALVDVRDSVDGMLQPEAPPSEQRESSPSSEYRVLVESALRHLNDLPALTHHPLLGRTPSRQQPDRPAVERAALLRGDLIEAIERLRPPSGPRPDPGNSMGAGGWLHYLVLHEAYVQGRPNKQIMQRYYISESSFHRARRRAVDTVAFDLHQRAELRTAELRMSPRPV
jgi:hypothetical protein